MALTCGNILSGAGSDSREDCVDDNPHPDKAPVEVVALADAIRRLTK